MWEKIKEFFKDSETIFWARVQLVMGAIAAALTYLDPAVLQQILPENILPWYLLFNGLATEYLRRRRESM